MEATDFIAVVGAATGSVLAAAFAYFTLRIASRSRREAEEARFASVRDQRTNITIEGNGRVINISDAQLLTSDQFAELRRIIENEMPPASQEQGSSTPTVPLMRTDDVAE
ncbi:hypothetical protein [Streptomyces viridochromogenes]|uniref:hypothetical protein n=1 Tax=Streptomyces viridochromogenes TaxID=1938 RepID=UPI00131C60E2|nr:hypothetical protein [Streptomyces viridochromogenes]